MPELRVEVRVTVIARLGGHLHNIHIGGEQQVARILNTQAGTEHLMIYANLQFYNYRYQEI